MRTIRAYHSSADLDAMLAVAHADPAAQVHLIDLPYRLCSWAFDTPENTALWFAGDRLAAWAVLQPPFWELDCAVDPSLAPAGMYDRVLEWVNDAAPRLLDQLGGRPAWFTAVFPHQAERIHALESAGFTCRSTGGADDWSKVLMERSATPPDLVGLPEGYRVRSLAGEAEVAAYVTLHQETFETRNMTVEWRARTLRHPRYRAELDLVVEAPDSSLAGFCIGWFDPAGYDGVPCAEIEPMGVSAAHRRRGLSRALLAEQVRCMITLGARRLFVKTDNDRGPAVAAYHNAGFTLRSDVIIYGKEF